MQDKIGLLLIKKRILIIELLVFFCAPILLLTFYDGFRLLRYVLLSVGVIYTLGFMRIRKLTYRDIGLRQGSLKPSLMLGTVLTVIAALGLLVGFSVIPDAFKSVLLGLKTFDIPMWPLLLSYVFLSVPIQEVVFRGLIINRLEAVNRNPFFTVFFSAFIFSLAHIFIKNILLVSMTFLAGLFWGWLFVKYRNIWTIQLSHAVLGGMVIWFGLS